MKTQTSPLFEPININGKNLRNRFVVAPMTRTSADASGVPTPEMCAYYTAFARGGFGLIITEGTYTDAHYSKASYHQPGIVNAAQVAGWQEVTAAVKAFDTLIISQLMHAGALSRSLRETIAPSALAPLDPPSPEAALHPYPFPRAMQERDFELTKEGFVQSAVRAQEAGFDGVELHAANGYLFDQFITAYTNQRTDRYGGSIPERLRFLREVFEAVREAVGVDFMVGIRFSEGKVNNLAYRWEGGAETASAIYNEVAKWKPDYIHIAAEGGQWARECRYPDGSSSNSIARSLAGVPVIANGGMHDTSLAEKLLAEGHADLFSIGRAAIADPSFPDKLLRGEVPAAFEPGMIRPDITLQNTAKYKAAAADKLCFLQ